MSEHFTSILRVIEGKGRRDDGSEGEEIQLSLSTAEKSVTLPRPAPPPSSSVRLQPAQASFSFDNAYGAGEDDRAVYKSGVRKTVENTLLGYNGTVISLEACGGGRNGSESPLHDTISRASEQIFRCLKKSKSSRSATNLVVHCSFVAVADENAYDLIAGFSDGANEGENGVGATQPPFHPLLTSGDGQPNASIHEAKSQSQVFSLLQQGYRKERELVEWIQSQRCSASLRSSRAQQPENVREHHTILSLTVQYAHFGTMNAPVSGTLSFLRLSSPYPLAHRDQYMVGERAERSALSLLTLAEVVDAITQEPSGSLLLQSSPSQRGNELYSKSLLTQLMKDAVGGNCKTVFMCHVPESIPSSSLLEVSSALQLVSRAKSIRNKPNKRDLAERALMAAYMKQLKLQYDGQGAVEGEDSASSGATDMKEDERQRAMELAATALAQAVGSSGGQGGGEDSESSEDEGDGATLASPSHGINHANSQTTKLSVSLCMKKGKKPRGRKQDSGGVSATSSGVTIDALVGVLQDPDRGVPRALETRLKDVKIRRDVGAVFSGADIVKWMVASVEGVDSESDAVILGQLLLDAGAIFHSEGSTVFANADSLFYYARDARLGKRLLSPEEIQALLSRAKEPEATNVTSVPIARRDIEGGEEDGEDIGGGRGVGREGGGVGDENGFHGDSASDGFGLSDDLIATYSSGGFDPTNTAGVADQWSPQHTRGEGYGESNDPIIQPPVDQSSEVGGVGKERRRSQASVESWMLDRDREEEGAADQPTADGQGEDEKKEVVAEGTPNTAPQQSIPSMHTLENSQDYPHPLHMAVAVGKHPGVIRNLVMMFGVNKTDNKGRTPLMFAALGNKRASCSTLIDCGADLNASDASGLTALHVACYHGAREAARVLLSKKASVTKTDKMGHTAVHWATKPDSPACLQLLLDYLWPSVLQQVDSSGLTALHWAIFYNHPHHLKLLLKKFPDALAVDSSGRTLLTYTIERQLPNGGCISVLLESCPSLSTQEDSNGRLPLHLASISPSPRPLSLLTTHSSHVTKSTPVDVNCVDPYKRTPLHYAAAANQLENTQTLLAMLADPLAVDCEGRTPLDYASQLEDGAAMTTLLQAGPQVEETYSVKSGTPRTHRKPKTPGQLSTTSTTDSEDLTSKVCTLL